MLVGVSWGQSKALDMLAHSDVQKRKVEEVRVVQVVQKGRKDMEQNKVPVLQVVLDGYLYGLISLSPIMVRSLP